MTRGDWGKIDAALAPLDDAGDSQVALIRLVDVSVAFLGVDETRRGLDAMVERVVDFQTLREALGR